MTSEQKHLAAIARYSRADCDNELLFASLHAKENILHPANPSRRQDLPAGGRNV